MSNYLVLPCGKTDFLLDNASTCFSGSLKKLRVLRAFVRDKNIFCGIEFFNRSPRHGEHGV